MLSKLISRWWLILLFILGFGLAGLIAAEYINYRMPPLFMGHAALLVKPGGTKIAPLKSIAEGRNVLSNSVNDLAALNIESSPRQLVTAMRVDSVRDTNVATVEVIMPDPQAAYVTTNVVVNELKKEFRRLYAAGADQSGNTPSIDSVDTPYVRATMPHQTLRLAFGLFSGLTAGVLFGLMIAAAIPRKESKSAI